MLTVAGGILWGFMVTHTAVYEILVGLSSHLCAWVAMTGVIAMSVPQSVIGSWGFTCRTLKCADDSFASWLRQ